MKKFKFSTLILAFMMFLGSFAACNPVTSSQEPTSTHTCESVCPTCGKCTDADCTEDACAEKCECTPADPDTPANPDTPVDPDTPAHICESVCPTCNKCLDADCTEAACADKCQGHHVCESVCPVCGKCMDEECTENACAEKCSICINPNWDTYELNVMSFNISASVAAEAEDKTIETSWANRRENVMNLINNSGADIISLQEVTLWADKEYRELSQYIYLQENLASDYVIVYVDCHADQPGVPNIATIYNKKVFNLITTEEYWLSDTPDVASTGWDGANCRAVSVITLEHRTTGEKVRVINTQGPVSAAGSVKGLEYIANRTLKTNPEMATILCGDLNVEPGNGGYVNVADVMQDCRLTAQENTDLETRTWNNYSDTDDKIQDYVFVNGNDAVKVLTYKVHDDKVKGKYISDHFAVQVTVRFYRNSDDAWSDFE